MLTKPTIDMIKSVSSDYGDRVTVKDGSFSLQEQLPSDVPHIVRIYLDDTSGKLILEKSDGSRKALPGFVTSNVLSAIAGVKSGQRGDRGEPGRNGKNGQDGEIGDIGDRGAKGNTGDSGPRGDKGPIGFDGLPGNLGYPGDRGDRGKRGEKGDEGNKGRKGQKGLRGKKGPKGSVGVRGGIGEQGDIGITGPIGNTGVIGPQGERGKRGIVGPKGEEGCPGADGLRFPDCSDGRNGANGKVKQIVAGSNMMVTDMGGGVIKLDCIVPVTTTTTIPVTTTDTTTTTTTATTSLTCSDCPTSDPDAYIGYKIANPGTSKWTVRIPANKNEGYSCLTIPSSGPVSLSLTIMGGATKMVTPPVHFTPFDADYSVIYDGKTLTSGHLTANVDYVSKVTVTVTPDGVKCLIVKTNFSNNKTTTVGIDPVSITSVIS